MHCVTQGSTTFRLNLHVNDLAHSVVFGRTGSGKSTLLALIAAQLRRYPNMTLYAFDKGLSLYPLTAAIRASTRGVSGQHFTVAGDDDNGVNAVHDALVVGSSAVWVGSRKSPGSDDAIPDSLGAELAKRKLLKGDGAAGSREPPVCQIGQDAEVPLS